MKFTSQYFQLDDDDKYAFRWPTQSPWCIIACLLGKEKELVMASGALVMRDIKDTDKVDNEIARLIVMYNVPTSLFDECASICYEKGIRDANYFFGVLRNKMNMN